MPHTAAPEHAPARRTRRKAARPGELLDAALALFVEKGFAGTRVEDVAARAGVSKGTLFLYFASKDELFKAVVRENAGRHLQDAVREVDGFAGPSAELLREFLRRWWLLYGGTPAAGLTKLMLSEAAHFPELAHYFEDEVIQPSHALLQRVVQRGIDRGEFRALDVPRAVHLIVAPLVQMVTWRHTLGHCCPYLKEDQPMALIELHADLLIRGLRAEAAP
ncbi:MAG: TetR/AcrR family transcriptional regulator [Burkholderiaceae bacterium]